MKKEKLYRLDKTIKKILEEDEIARKDDNYLIFKVVQEIAPDMAGSTFASVMFSAQKRGLSFESITRARRKVQQTFPELSDKKTVEIRQEETQEYVEYATEKR